MRKYRNHHLSCGNFVKKPSKFRLDVNLLTDESAPDEFCSIIRLSTEFILGTNYPSETDNPSRRTIRLYYKFGQFRNITRGIYAKYHHKLCYYRYYFLQNINKLLTLTSNKVLVRNPCIISSLFFLSSDILQQNAGTFMLRS